MAYVTIDPTRTDADSIVDQSLMDDIRNDLNDLNARLNVVGIVTTEGIHDNFAADSFNIQQGTPGLTDYPYTWLLNGGTLPTLAANPDHYAVFLTSGGNYSVMAASKYKMRVDLSKDHTFYCEFRHRDAQSDAAVVWTMGYQDAALLDTAGTIVTDQTDFIGFIQDGTANKYKAITAKAGTTTTAASALGDGVNTTWHILRAEITFSGATQKVDFFFDGALVGTSTSNIPDIRLRPVLGFSGGAAARTNAIDYCDFEWTQHPLS